MVWYPWKSSGHGHSSADNFGVFQGLSLNIMEPPTSISSHRNPHFKRWLSLLDSKGIKRHHQCIISGEKITKSILHNPNVLIHSIILSPLHPENHETFSHFSCYTLPQKLFQDLDIFGTHSPLLVCDTPVLPTADLTKAPSGLEVICPVGDPGNLGTILRSCLAFGVQKIILPQEAVHPFHPKVIRGSSGAVFSLRLEANRYTLHLELPSLPALDYGIGPPG